ncbi:ATPase family AAA domain-containing protein 2-like isoform X2 [Oscarella lobularis]|uniref:ATPase family AAA domain-containing protein 2-like isoform X2 n=1 Tax=Oscarella lobularis TaxID=121494 RepID=UPI0033133E11
MTSSGRKTRRSAPVEKSTSPGRRITRSLTSEMGIRDPIEALGLIDGEPKRKWLDFTRRRSLAANRNAAAVAEVDSDPLEEVDSPRVRRKEIRRSRRAKRIKYHTLNVALIGDAIHRGQENFWSRVPHVRGSHSKKASLSTRAKDTISKKVEEEKEVGEEEENEEEEDDEEGEKEYEATSSSESSASEEESRTYNLRENRPAIQRYENEFGSRPNNSASTTIINSPAWRQNRRHHRARVLQNDSTTSSSSESDSEAKFSRRKKKSLARARRHVLPMNLTRADVTKKSLLRERVRVGSSLADIDPMAIDATCTFESVGGLARHVESLKEMLFFPLLYPDLYGKLGVTAPRGVLFHGPPGTGKTLVARALANECSKGERKVSFFMRKGADCLSKWFGESERQLRLLFDQAYKLRPSIIFFDEIDGLAPVRSSRQDQIHNSIVSTLLALMDGLDSRGDVIVIGATNRIDSIDPALRRPGRFDRELVFPLPADKAREQILKICTKSWVPPLSTDVLSDLVAQTSSYTGADLMALCSKAAMCALRRTYPQVYATTNKLAIDVDKVRVGEEDLCRALASFTPSCRRNNASPGKRLAPFLRPLLDSELEDLFDTAQRLLPGYQSLSNVLTTTSICDLDASSASTASNPAILIIGEVTHLGPGLIQMLEGLACFSLDIDSVLGRTVRSPEEACVEIIREAEKRTPCILYVPDVTSLWAAVTSSFHLTFLSLMRRMSTSILTVVTSLTPFDSLPEELRSVFRREMKTVVKVITSTGARKRRSFFEDLFLTYPLKEPAQQTKVPAHPSIPIVDTKRELSEKEKRRLEKERESTLRELRIFLRDLTNRLLADRKFTRFAKPVDKEDAPDYFEVIQNPMNLSMIMKKVDQGGYATPKQWLNDITLIRDNCFEYNPEDEVGCALRHRAASMHDIAYSWVSRELDSDFEALCEELEEGQKEKETTEEDCETLAVVPGTETTDFDMSGFELHEDNDAENRSLVVDHDALERLLALVVLTTFDWNVRELEQAYSQLNSLVIRHKDCWDKTNLIKEMSDCVHGLESGSVTATTT